MSERLIELVRMRREGQEVNHKRLFRIYREERPHVRCRGGRKRAIGTRAPMALPLMPNRCWSLDLASEQLTDGCRVRVLKMVDDCTQDCLAPIADTSQLWWSATIAPSSPRTPS